MRLDESCEGCGIFVIIKVHHCNGRIGFLILDFLTDSWTMDLGSFSPLIVSLKVKVVSDPGQKGLIFLSWFDRLWRGSCGCLRVGDRWSLQWSWSKNTYIDRCHRLKPEFGLNANFVDQKRHCTEEKLIIYYLIDFWNSPIYY